MVSLSDIQQIFSGTIKLSEPLASYTSLGVGGPADYVLQPLSPDTELDKLIMYFQGNEFPCIIMQPNSLVSEKGFRGAVIIPKENNEHAFLKNSATIFKPSDGISAAHFIEQADVNGLLWGGAEIVGNCIVSAHRATAHELCTLVHHVRNIIKDRCGVELELELQLIGFDQEMLANVA